MVYNRTVGGQIQINKEIISQGLRNVRTVNFEGHEHDNGEYHDACINLPHQPVLLSPGPPCRWIETMHILPGLTRSVFDVPWDLHNSGRKIDSPVGSGLVFLGKHGVVVDTRKCCDGVQIVGFGSLPEESLLLERDAEGCYFCQRLPGCRRFFVLTDGDHLLVEGRSILSDDCRHFTQRQ